MNRREPTSAAGPESGPRTGGAGAVSTRESSGDGDERVRTLERIGSRSLPSASHDERISGPERGPSVDARANTERASSWELLLPFALAVAYVPLGLASGTDLFDTGQSGAAGGLAIALLGTLLFVAAWSTARLYADGRAAAAASNEWRPDPWHYVGGGASVLVLYPVFELIVGDLAVERPLVYLTGTAVVALLLSSTVAGPVYLLRRRASAPVDRPDPRSRERHDPPDEEGVRREDESDGDVADDPS